MIIALTYVSEEAETGRVDQSGGQGLKPVFDSSST